MVGRGAFGGSFALTAAALHENLNGNVVDDLYISSAPSTLSFSRSLVLQLLSLPHPLAIFLLTGSLTFTIACMYVRVCTCTSPHTTICASVPPVTLHSVSSPLVPALCLSSCLCFHSLARFRLFRTNLRISSSSQSLLSRNTTGLERARG